MKLINAKEILFSTKNYNKILAAYNSLSYKEKQELLHNEDVILRIKKIANTSLLINLLIDLPYEYRIDFLSNLDDLKNTSDPDYIVLAFLHLPNYYDWNIGHLNSLKDLKDKDILIPLFRKLSSTQLKNIIIANYNQVITGLAFFEYSKKNDDLLLEKDIIDLIEENNLYLELKRRKKRNQTTSFNIDEFLLLDNQKQNCILNNSISISFINELLVHITATYETYNQQELIQRFKELLKDFNYPKLVELQVIISKLDDENALTLIKEFFVSILKFPDSVVDKYAYSLIYLFRELTNKTDIIWNLTKVSPFAVINYLNTSILNPSAVKILENKLTIEQYKKVNIRHINKIINFLNILYQGSNNFSKDVALILAYKLYLIFGYENTIDLLNKRFGFLDYKTLFNLIINCDVKSVKLTKKNNSYEPILKSEFITFLIGDKKDNNTTLKRMLRGELDIIKNNFYNIYNSFERYQLSIGEKIHLNKLIPLLGENNLILLPNEYKLTKDIIDNIIKSFRYTDVIGEQPKSFKDEKKWFEEACYFYHTYIEKKVLSSIPRVIGKTKDNYSYEILKLNDPIILTLGYLTGCCFRLNGESSDFLKYCSESPYARVIVIRNEQNEICSMVPIIRNGNVINGNSIEKNSLGETKKIYDALKQCYDKIIETSKNYEDNPIEAGLVTNLHNNCYSKEKINRHIYPIREDSFYTNYDKRTYIVSCDENFKEDDISLFTPKVIYYDERPEVIVYSWNSKDEKELRPLVEQRVKSIMYNNNSKLNFYLSHFIICSEDWYLKIDFDYVYGECLTKDPRAIIEYKAVKKYLEEKIANETIYSSELNKDEINSLIPKKLTF